MESQVHGICCESEMDGREKIEEVTFLCGYLRPLPDDHRALRRSGYTHLFHTDCTDEHGFQFMVTYAGDLPPRCHATCTNIQGVYRTVEVLKKVCPDPREFPTSAPALVRAIRAAYPDALDIDPNPQDGLGMTHLVKRPS